MNSTVWIWLAQHFGNSALALVHHSFSTISLQFNWKCLSENRSSICANSMSIDIGGDTSLWKPISNANFSKILHSIQFNSSAWAKTNIKFNVKSHFDFYAEAIFMYLFFCTIPKVQLNSYTPNIHLFGLSQSLISHIRILHTHTQPHQMKHNECSVHSSMHFYVLGMPIKQAGNVQTGQWNYRFLLVGR